MNAINFIIYSFGDNCDAYTVAGTFSALVKIRWILVVFRNPKEFIKIDYDCI